MGLLRRDTTVEAAGTTAPDGSGDDDVYVVSRKAAGHAAKAEKERRKAATIDRRIAEAELKNVKSSGAPTDVTGVADVTAAELADVAAAESGSKDAKKAAKKAAKAAEKNRKKAKDAGPEPVTGTTVKRYIGIARVVVPVLAPLVYQAVGEARSRWELHRARQLGVAPDQLADFTGRGAALYARIHHLALSVRDLRTRRGDDRETQAFVDDAQNRLADLEAAVRSAEQMPSGRRRSAHAAVSGELDRVETRLLAFWGVDGAGGAGHGSLPSGTSSGTSSGARGDAPR